MEVLPTRLFQATRLSRPSVMRVSSRLDPAKPHPQGVACCLSTTLFREWFIRMNRHHSWFPVHTYELDEDCLSSLPLAVFGNSPVPRTLFAGPERVLFSGSRLHSLDDGCATLPHESAMFDVVQFIRMNSDGKDRPVHTYELGRGSPTEASGQRAVHSRRRSERSKAQAAADYASDSSTVVDSSFMPDDWISSQFIRMNSGGKRRPVHTYELGVGSHIDSCGRQATLCLRRSECSEAQAAEDYIGGSSIVVDGGFMPHDWLSSQFIRMNRSSTRLPHEKASGNEFDPESNSGSRCASFVLHAASSESDETSSAIGGRRTERTQPAPKAIRKLPVHTYEFGSPPPGFTYSCAEAQFIRMNSGGVDRHGFDAFALAKSSLTRAFRERCSFPWSNGNRLAASIRFSQVVAYPSWKICTVSAMQGPGQWFIRMNHGAGGTCTSPPVMVHTYEPTMRTRMRHLPTSASALHPTEPRRRAGFGVSGVHVLEIQPMT